MLSKESITKSPSIKAVKKIPAPTLSAPTPTSSNTNTADTVPYKVGDKVYLSSIKKVAIVKFIGKAHFSAGVWVGLELPDATGKNNGSVLGQKYFTCKPMHGIFVRPALCVTYPSSKSSSAPAASPETNTLPKPTPSAEPRINTTSPSTKPILRKSVGNDGISTIDSKIKTVVWSENLTIPSTASSPPTSTPSKSLVSHAPSTPAKSPSANTENLLGRIDSALTKSQFVNSASGVSVSSPASPVAGAGNLAGTGGVRPSSSSGVVKSVSSRSSAATTTARPATSLRTSTGSTSGRASLPMASTSTTATAVVRPLKNPPPKAAEPNKAMFKEQLLSDSGLLKELANIVLESLTENTTGSSRFERMVEDVVESLKTKDTLPSIESVVSVNRRVDGLEDILTGISSRVDKLIFSVESFVERQPRGIRDPGQGSETDTDGTHYGVANGFNDTSNSAVHAKELETQIAYLKQALGGVAQLTRQAMDATARERWEHTQQVAKLEQRLRKLEVSEGNDKLNM